MGDVKVSPLSVPPSSSSTSSSSRGVQDPFWHRSRLSTPMNQSGEGMILEMKETMEWFPSTIRVEEV